MSVHQGKRIVHRAAVEAGHQCAPYHGDEDQHADPACAAHAGRAGRCRHGFAEPGGGMQHGPVNRDGETEMCGKPVLADRRLVDQAGFHHVPAERPLQPAQDKQKRQAAGQAAVDIARQAITDHEPQEWQ